MMSDSTGRDGAGTSADFLDREGERTRAEVALIVITYNSERFIGGLLASLPDALQGCTWKLVVVDNRSDDHTVNAVRAGAPDAVVVESTCNLGYAAGVNIGIAAAGPADSYFVLNPDVRLGAGAVRKMRDCMRSDDVGIVVPRVVDADGSLMFSLRREPNIRRSIGDTLLGSVRAGRSTAWGEIITRPESYEAETAADWATGAVLLVSGRCAAVCGPWDESFFLYSEETEFCLRAGRKGFRLVLAPQAVATHVGGDSRVSDALRSLVVVNRVLLYSRDHSLLGVLCFWLTATIRELSRLLTGKPASWRALRTMLSPSLVRRICEQRSVC